MTEYKLTIYQVTILVRKHMLIWIFIEIFYTKFNVLKNNIVVIVVLLNFVCAFLPD